MIKKTKGLRSNIQVAQVSQVSENHLKSMKLKIKREMRRRGKGRGKKKRKK